MCLVLWQDKYPGFKNFHFRFTGTYGLIGAVLTNRNEKKRTCSVDAEGSSARLKVSPWSDEKYMTRGDL